MENHKIHLRIGKNGITQGLIQEINDKFEQTDPVVIKLLKSHRDEHNRKETAQQLAELTKSRVKKLVGGTVTLTKHKKKAPQKTGTS